MSEPIAIDEVNRLSLADFVARFGDVAEHSPWVAEKAAAMRPYSDRARMVAAFEVAMRAAGKPDRLALIRAHPDLAGKAALAGTMAEDSRKEQKGAGLDSLTADEYARFTDFNDSYKNRFGFPFIFAVKGATKDMILDAFAARLQNDTDTEFEMAMTQIARIFRFRLEDRVLP